MWGLDAGRDKLERRLLSVHCVLADAEVKGETNPAVRRWMKELKAVAYQADDVLDCFRYEGLRRQAQTGESMARKVQSYFTTQSPLLFRFTICRTLNRVLKKMDELVMEMNTFGLVEGTEVLQGLYRQTHSALDESAEIYGRDRDKELVVKLLLDQQDQHNVQVLPIIGMGGLGKTTLAKMVFNDSRVQKHFELKMWYCVSENFEATAIVKSIIELATNKRCDLPDTIELLRGRLQEVLGRKRYLLILDDVWNEEQQKWEDDLKPLLCSIGGSGSIIVVTSRSQQVASIMGTLPPHELACLSEDGSWELFSKKAFSKGVQERAEFVTIGRRIVNKCKGLPLALKTMGGLMSSKQQALEWQAIAESNLGDTVRGKDEILSILKLSYQHLSPEMKRCFAFCAVFPKDYEMEKDMLIQLWIANGFICEEGTMDLEQKAEFIFNDLVWRSFLQVFKLVKQAFYGSKRESNGCKMHDLMHDLAKAVANECATAEELIQQKASIKDVRHVQMSNTDELKQVNRLFKGTISLGTLLALSTSDKDLTDLKPMTLRALCCYSDHPSIVRSQFVNTAHLRYLDLSGSHSIVRLPNSVCMMYNLQSLRLNNCYQLRYLPEGMATMRKLSHIYLLGCHNLERMPPNLSQLHNLRTLTTFVVDTEDGFGIEELKDLRHLGNRLELYNLEKVKTGSKANIHGKQNLSELLLYWNHKESVIPRNGQVGNEEEVLESLVPHSELKILEVHGYVGLTISQWMRDPHMFQCLRELRISNCPRCKDLPLVWLSSSLEHLSLSCMVSLTTLCKQVDVEAARYNSTPQIFPRLKRMTLDNLPNLENWTEDIAGETSSFLMFPQLEELRIYDCFKLASLPESPVLTNLTCISYSVRAFVSMSMPLGSWPSLVSLNVGLLANIVIPPEDQQSQGQRSLDTLRSLETKGDNGFVSIFSLSKLRLGPCDCFAFVEELVISSCYNIVHWPVEELRCMPRIRSLRIWHCTNLEGKGSSSEEILPLPHLERLWIASCGRLLEIPKLPASLEEMKISYGISLVALPSNLGNLAKLRKLGMWGCNDLRELPDGMDGLTSLERLSISGCPGIEKFPQGLLQQLSALKYLYIHDCPDLQRRCTNFFPKDYEIEKDMLIQLWMANGYIHEEGTMDLAQKGEFVFNELTWRSFFKM
ncbi:putative disease resistance protein RGA1 [Dichanthelium oligosanthes]|uniref:Putative disease resistance protein RGA1 n=1 Tax=Dichanthelium oligosanthes TaxID=888268 RepID=A0A1E5W663_9POAL|nr:putative disease resistance protein RGA1 [Dichanthelium oligosanthes]